MLSSIFDVEFNPHKHLVHINRVTALAQGQDVSPVTLELDVISACHHHCHWCVDPPGSHSNQIMTVPTAQRIMEEAKDLGVKGIVFKGGGESTLHPEFPEILRIADELGFEIGLVTNGGHLRQDALLQAIVEHCAYLRVSIDGPTRESRQDIHGVDDFDQLVLNTKRLMALRGAQRHPIIGATFCLDYARRTLIGQCIQLGESFNLDYVLIRPPFCEEVGFPSPHTPQEAAMLRKEICQAARQYTGKMPVMAGNWVGDQEWTAINSTTSQSDLARRDVAIRHAKQNGIEHLTGRCLASPLFLVVSAGGEVYGCCCLRGIRKFSFGIINYASGMTLASIMSNEQRKKILARMRQVECLQYCTHPLAKINEIIGYLALPQKFHSSFI